MGQRNTRNGAPRLARDAYPVIRITSEHFLRHIDLVTATQPGGLVSGLVFVAVWLAGRSPRGAVGVREVARQLDQPPETVRRHVTALLRAGTCVAREGGVALHPGVARRCSTVEYQLGVCRTVQRMLADLRRAGLARDLLPEVRLRRGAGGRADEAAVAAVATRHFLAAIRILGRLWQGDLARGVVFTALWTANVKHVTNSRPAAWRRVLPDGQRRPVSVLAIAQSLRLPYETVRRHAVALERAGTCVRIGRAGLVVPARVHRSLAAVKVDHHDLVRALLADLARVGALGD